MAITSGGERGARRLSSRNASPRWGPGCGLDRLLEDPSPLRGRRYGLLCHQASLSASWEPAPLALCRREAPPVVLFGPEHGIYGVEQDMVAAEDLIDPLTSLPVSSLYGDTALSLRPRPQAFEGLDLLVVDLQDIGTRYYTFAASAVWAAEAAIAADCEVWVLDRPNPLGGQVVEGNLPDPGLESFVSAFRVPVRHGLTLAELVRLESLRRSWDQTMLRFFTVPGWRREHSWFDIGRPWIAPSPNMPSAETAWIYPGGCLLEATQLSEGRGTTRPFLLFGAPFVDPAELTSELQAIGHPGVAWVPAFFRPQFQKHAGELCGGAEVVLTDRARIEPLRLGVEVLGVLRRLYPDDFEWRADAYEFVDEVPAIDLLAGTPRLRRLLDEGAEVEDWISSWAADERAFVEERAPALLYR